MCTLTKNSMRMKDRGNKSVEVPCQGDLPEDHQPHLGRDAKTNFANCVASECIMLYAL